MPDDKWITGLSPGMATSEAAKKTLALRLGAVRDRLPSAVFRADDDVENVHHLRVSTRRAAAALRLFADSLPERLHRKTRKALRELRRSAAEARDWDVFLEMLRSQKATAKQRRGLDFLLGFAHGQRVLAQDHLHQAFAARAEKFTERIKQVNDTLESARTSRQKLGDLATPMLTQLLHELESAANGDLQRYEALHQVRILGKQLRYAMEIFESCFPPDFRGRHYSDIVEMQEILGIANDSFTATQRLTLLRARLIRMQPKQWPAYRGGIEALLSFHERTLPQQRKKFEKWWKAWQKTGADSAFAKLIGTNRTM